MPLLIFQPTRPLRGATTATTPQIIPVAISTHAPLAGRDLIPFFYSFFKIISTHAPLAGRDKPDLCTVSERSIFQPTRPLRGAT